GWGGAGTPVIVGNGASLGINAGAVMPNPITLNGTTTGSGAMFSYSSAGGFSGPITLNATSGVGGANDFTLSGTISGNGGLLKLGAGTVTLTGSNTGYNGGTTVSAGMLRVTAPDSFALDVPGTVTVQSGATLECNNGFGDWSLFGGGFVVLNGANARLSGPSTFSGNITGTGSVYAMGIGAQPVQLTGNNTFNGGLTFDGLPGLYVNGDGAMGTGGAGVAVGKLGTYGKLGWLAATTLGTGRTFTVGNGF